MSKAEKTKEFIIEKSAPIFNKKGYAGTSLADIMEATNLTKGSIYGNFENKDELAIAAYKHNVSFIKKRIYEYVNSEETATNKLMAFTEHYRVNWKKIFERGGCPIQNACIEADDSLSFLKKHVQQTVKGLTTMLSTIIEEGQKNKEFDKNCNAQEYAYSIIIILEGGMQLAKIMNNQQLLFSALDRIERLIDQELKK